MKRIFILFFTISISFLYSQEFTLKGIMSDRSLYPERLSQMQWAKKHNSFYHVKGTELIVVNTKGESNTATTLGNLNNVLIEAALDTLSRMPQIEIMDDNSMIFWIDSTLFTYNWQKNTLKKTNTILKNAENIEINYDNFNVIYTIENNLYIAVNNKNIAISNENDKAIVYGQSVHRNEFGIEKGIFLSPQGNYVAFYRMDETMITDYPIVKIEDPIAASNPIKYPMAGTLNHKVTLGVYNIKSQEITYLKANEWDDQYLTSIAWSLDEKHIYVGVINRDQNVLRMNRYNAVSGDFETLIFEDVADKYVEPQTPPFFVEGDTKHFYYLSQRSGYNQLFSYSIKNNSAKMLSNAGYLVNDILGISPQNNTMVLSGISHTPTETVINTYNYKSDKLTTISNEKGRYSALVSYDGSFLVTTFSNVDVPSRIQMIDLKGNLITTLLESSDKSKIHLAQTEIFTIKANDNITDLYCRMLKPSNFEPAKKYPVIVYVYGGPHAQMISNSWTGGAGLFLHYLAQKGYIVFTLDNRGSANRGLEFEQAIHRNLGDIEVLDQMQGIAHLKTLSYIDTNRIGVHGWSYGGYMTMMMMLKHPDVFKVGVAGGPVTDWKYYEIMYGERYMGTPQNNKEGYEKASLLNKIQDLKGRLLVIHGDEDPVVVWQHSMELLKKAIEEDVLIDYAVYPGHEHNVRGLDRAHLMKRIETYFNDFLK